MFFQRIKSLYQDPIFAHFEYIGVDIFGMPVSFVADGLTNLQSSTLVIVKLPLFFHPTFQIIDGEVVKLDQKLEAAKRGSKFYPHKDLIIEKLYECAKQNLLPLNIEDYSISSNLFLNFLVLYQNRMDGIEIAREIYTMTNIDTFVMAKRRYVDELNKIFMQDDLIDLIQFVQKTSITSSANFLDFCYKFMELVIKKPIEYGGLTSSLWEGAKKGELVPVKEKKAQVIIYHVMKQVAALKGIQISREIESADGSLDYHFSYNSGKKLLKVCVELKNAHHDRLDHGINTQLPLYIKDEGQKEGIFLVLWYKNEVFNKPKKYSLETLHTHLMSQIPNRFKIRPLIINCTKKASPSTREASERLL